jgi:hypothetical protein
MIGEVRVHLDRAGMAGSERCLSFAGRMEAAPFSTTCPSFGWGFFFTHRSIAWSGRDQATITELDLWQPNSRCDVLGLAGVDVQPTALFGGEARRQVL